MNSYIIDQEHCADVHSVIYLLPTLLARFGFVELYECGGCQIDCEANAGKRPVSHMLSIMREFDLSCEHIGDKISSNRSLFMIIALWIL